MATRCPASGLLVACLVWALDAPTPLIRRLGRMHEVGLRAVTSLVIKQNMANQEGNSYSYFTLGDASVNIPVMLTASYQSSG